MLPELYNYEFILTLTGNYEFILTLTSN